MAVDTTLIKGAYAANVPKGVAGVKQIGEMAGSVTKAANTYIAGIEAKHTTRNAEYDAFSKEVLNNSDLIGEQYEDLYDQLALGKEPFASADKKSRDLQIRDLKAMAGDYDDYKTLREEVAINLDDYSPVWQGGDEGQAYLKILKGEGKYLEKKDGRIGVEVDGEWRSMASIKQDIDAHKIDKLAIDELEAWRLKTQADDSEFDYNKTRTTILNSFVSKSSYNSLINDEIAGNKIFKVQLMEALMNQKYSDLGITDEELQNVVSSEEMQSIKADGMIDAEEAENIFKHLKGDKSAMKEVLADYFTIYIQNNGIENNKQSNNSNAQQVDKTAINESYGFTDEEVVEKQQVLIDGGYDIKEDGVWGPDSESAWQALHTSNPDIDIDPDGVYVPPIKEKKKKRGQFHRN